MAKQKRPADKAKNLVLTPEYLASRTYPGGKAKWIEYAEAMLARGLRVTLYEPIVGTSKYLTVHMHGRGKYKVRFSNHKPNVHREFHKHCDFFVGITNFGITTTAQAIAATLKRFDIPWDQPRTEDLHQQLYGEEQHAT